MAWLLDVIRNKVFDLSSQMTFAISNTQIVQAGCGFHETIGTVRMSIAQRILDTARTLDAGNRVFDSHAYTRQGAIVPFLARRQFFAAWLFLG
jgi:hypothetical protein